MDTVSRHNPLAVAAGGSLIAAAAPARSSRMHPASLRVAFLVGLMVLCLSACSHGEEGLFRSSNLQRTYGGGLSVNIANVENEAEGRPYAEQYCKRLGKTAHFERMELLSDRHETAMSALFHCASRPVPVPKI
jgi:hypothetical protein